MAFKPSWVVVITNENHTPDAPYVFGFFDYWDEAVKAAYFETEGNVFAEDSEWDDLNEWYYQADGIWVCEFNDITSHLKENT